MSQRSSTSPGQGSHDTSPQHEASTPDDAPAQQSDVAQVPDVNDSVQEGTGENAKLSNEGQNEEEGKKVEDKTNHKSADKDASNKRKRADDSEVQSPPAKNVKHSLRVLLLPQVRVTGTSPYQQPTEQERATAKLGFEDTSKFKITLRRHDGTKAVWEYKAWRQAAFNWWSREDLVHLNKWATQIWGRAEFEQKPSTIRYTVDEAMDLLKIVLRALKSAKEMIVNEKIVNKKKGDAKKGDAKESRNLAWIKINKKFNGLMALRKALKGMEYAQSSRAADRTKAVETAVAPIAAEPFTVPTLSGTSEEGAKSHGKKATITEKKAKEGAAKKGTTKKAASKAKAVKTTTAVKAPKAAKKPKSYGHTVKEDHTYMRRKTTALRSQARLLPDVLAALKAGHQEPMDGDQETLNWDDSEYSCGDESSDESEDSRSEADGEADGDNDSDPGLEYDSDDEDEGRRPAGNELETQLLAAC